MKNEELAGELEAIRLADPEKRLHPEAVVKTVRRDKSHPLRMYFTWDRDEALDKIQLIEARQAKPQAIPRPPGRSLDRSYRLVRQRCLEWKENAKNQATMLEDQMHLEP